VQRKYQDDLWKEHIFQFDCLDKRRCGDCLISH
jgi:hypothetical protein